MSRSPEIPADASPRERSVRISYAQHVPALQAFVRKLVAGDRHKAEDIVQETILRCWNRFDGDDDTMLRPWLFVVARRLVIDSRRRTEARPAEVSGAAWLDQEPGEVDHIEKLLSSVVVSEAMKALTPAHREVLHLTYFQGRTFEEAARELGIAPGTVKSRVFYGLRSLKLALQERGVNQELIGSSTSTSPVLTHAGR
ncbi:sigma-70 family RNA polymerase sigma factor [Streptomyces sp. NPDC004822]